MSRNPRELRDALQSLGFGEDISVDDRSNWGAYVILVVATIAIAACLSFVTIYLLALRHFGLEMESNTAAESFIVALSAFILFTAVFLTSENLRDKWLSSGDWEEALGCYVKQVVSATLWSALITTILVGFVNAWMGRGQGLTVLLPVGINNLLSAGLASGFFLVHMYLSARVGPARPLS